MYTVYVDDNFHYGDESHRYRAGTFVSYEQAIEVARRIVDQSLRDHVGKGMSSDEVLAGYLQFGDDPFIVPPHPDERFSARDYARARVKEIVEAGQG